MLYNMSFLLIYFMHCSLYFFISYPYLAFFPFVPSLVLWVCFYFVIFIHCSGFWTQQKVITVFVFLWLILLSIIPSRSIHVVAKWQNFILFYGWVIFYYAYKNIAMIYVINWSAYFSPRSFMLSGLTFRFLIPFECCCFFLV